MSEGHGLRWGAAIGGGVIGAVVTAGLLMLAAPSLMGERMVRQAMLAHPDILVEASEALRDRQYAPTLAAQRTAIETPYHSSWKGAAKPDVTLTYYYDYACGYCRKSNPDIERLLAQDKRLRVVYRELPILGPESVAASRVALAASRAGKFAAFHRALSNAGRPSPEAIAAAAAAVGIPGAPLESAEQEAELKQNFQVAGALGATGTPLFVIGDRVINSAVGYDVLKDAIEDARDRGMNLGTQLAASAGLLCLMALVHATGVIVISKALGLEDRTLRAHRVDLAAFGLLVTMALCLFALHLVEIGLFAAFYVAVGALNGAEPALFFSASAYTTLGTVEATLPRDWRLVGAIEGLVGFLLIGWSTGLFITDMNKLLRE